MALFGLSQQSQATPMRASGASTSGRKRKSRRTKTDRRRFSDARRFYEEANRGLKKGDVGYMSLEQAAVKAELQGDNLRVKLYKHISKTRAEMPPTQSFETPLAGTQLTPLVTRNVNDGTLNANLFNRVGRSGSKARTPEDVAENQRRKDILAGRTEHELYAERVQLCTTLLSQTPDQLKSQMSKALVEERFNDGVCQSITAKHLLYLSKTAPGEKPAMTGGTYLSDREIEFAIAFASHWRDKKLLVPPALLLEYCNSLWPSDDPRREQLGPHGFTPGILKSLYKRMHGHTGTYQVLDTERARWCSYANINAWYDLIASLALEEEMFERTMSEDVGDERIRIRASSGDETDLSLRQPPAKAKKDRGFFFEDEEDHDVAMTKGGRKISWMFGRDTEGRMLAPLIVFGEAHKPKEEWIDRSITGQVPDAEGNLIPAMWLANDNGGVNAAEFKLYYERVVIPSAKGSGCANEQGKRQFFIVDGCQTHVCDPSTTRMLKDAGVLLHFRVPNTSSKTQGEDTTIFTYDSRD